MGAVVGTSDQDLADFLGPKAYQIFALVAETQRSTRISETLRLAAEALSLLDSFEVERYEVDEQATTDLSMWNHVETPLTDLLSGVNSALDALLILFPVQPSDSVDLKFESAVDPQAKGGDELSWVDIDAVIETVDIQHQETLATAINSLVNMIRHDIQHAADRLRMARNLGDRWVVLAELQELRGKSSQCFEAIVAMVFRGLTDVDLENLFPRYQSELTRALEIRAAYVMLRSEVTPINEALAKAKDEDLPAFHATLLRIMTRVQSLPANRWMRPQDKHELFRFQLFLRSWLREGSNARKFRQKVEGFAKLLDVFILINRRVHLVRHDREVLRQALELLEQPRGIERVLPLLTKIGGRSDAIDAMVRATSRGEPLQYDRLKALCQQTLQELGS